MTETAKKAMKATPKTASDEESKIPEAKFVEPKSSAARSAAAESSDPEVHRLLAERQTAWMNDDDESAAGYTAALNELGVE